MKQEPETFKTTDFTFELARKLQTIIDEKVRVQAVNSDTEKLEDLKNDLTTYIEAAKALAEDYRSQGLTFNTVEAEGHLRAWLTVESILKEY
jgi:hypothetical protein